MTFRELTSTNAARAALGAVAITGALALWTLMSAIRLDAVPETPPLEIPTAEALSARPQAAFVDIRAAVEKDIFAPDRAAPAQRYRIPGETDPAVHVVPIESPKPVVLGIAISDSAHSFATCTLEGGTPTIVHIGDHLGEYTVKSIERGHVVFTTADGKKLDIPALKPGP
jgi:hypothetical protein